MLVLLEVAEDTQLDTIAPIVTLGLNHEQQHQELIVTDLKHMLSHNPLHPVYVGRAPNPELEVPPLEWLTFPEGVYCIGALAAASPSTTSSLATACSSKRSPWPHAR